MGLTEDFEAAAARSKQLTKRPSNEELLQMYALFKQASQGDVSGSRPGMMDFKGRAKYDAWAKIKGKDSEEAKQAYVNLVNGLFEKE
ncbi:acyl-CoA-binding protein [Microscilla marina]|uniref:Acyl-CoA binding protein n=1 Tax=Microscilla marina ATCC 23134 TaxID=313606 RepID=A1ZHF8_MICM2|nr:acyl-CoA-binding protein [Microscilla marina]EAY29965.1 acyl-CoA binding protein [Microscilla marina ATCC 23134]